ncbi:MAG: sugar phosphate isomerase/epimerase [Novosphingobium sp.]|nr:sugar phosphate isomerase/epimerase [Novosphingobium sp.]MCP5400838.1 sugar phosphate isomerase/epimerase [Novosphingobium sp.]
MSLSRRDVLRRTGTVMGALAAAGCATISTPPVRRPLGLAPITVRKQLEADYAGTLRQVAAMGYTHFGFPLAQMSAQMPAGPDPRDIATMVRDAGMEVGVVRYGFARPAVEQMELASRIGASIVAYSAAPVFFRGGKLGSTTRDAFDAWLPELGELAALARAAGLTLAYHNHWWDHLPLGGEAPLDIIARSYAPSEVAFEIDLAWAHLGGLMPLELIERLGPRVVSMHFKDVDPSRGDSMFDQLVAPGDGVLAYPDIVPQLDRLTNAVGYVEVDNPANELDAARRGARAIQQARALPDG